MLWSICLTRSLVCRFRYDSVLICAGLLARVIAAGGCGGRPLGDTTCCGTLIESKGPRAMSVDHEFGGQHTELKLSIVESYLNAYTKALRKKFDQLWYIDAFAGTGTRTVRVEGRDGGIFEAPVAEHIEQRRGSAQIAIDVRPSFNRMVFIDSNPRYCSALRELAARHSDRKLLSSRMKPIDRSEMR